MSCLIKIVQFPKLYSYGYETIKNTILFSKNLMYSFAEILGLYKLLGITFLKTQQNNISHVNNHNIFYLLFSKDIIINCMYKLYYISK